MSNHALPVSNALNLKDKLVKQLGSEGFEVHAFLVGWYNSHVSAPFQLSYPFDTLAFVVISTPQMFHKGFKNFVCRCLDADSSKDPIDDCMVYYFNQVKLAFPHHHINSIHDFELDLPSRRPKVLMQTAGHVSGAAYYYQRSDIKCDPWDPKQKIFGVCVHPAYGGWFGLRGVLIFNDIAVPLLPRLYPTDVLIADGQKVELLEKLNFHWEDWTFRDIIDVKERYCDEQKMYFGAKPSERKPIIERLKKKWLSENLDKS